MLFAALEPAAWSFGPLADVATLDFENEHAEVVAVHYGAHEKSAMHEHPGGVVVVITAGYLTFTDEKGKSPRFFAKPGEARWLLHSSTGSKTSVIRPTTPSRSELKG
jgi:quercetin dioxygenase-like cupin family protein